MKSVNDRLDGLWVKTAKWFISQRRYVKKQSLTGSLISVMCQPCSLLVQTAFFIGFEPFSARFKPYPVLVVQADARKDAVFRATGPMDTISVKSCATVASMSQKQTISLSGAVLNWLYKPTAGQDMRHQKGQIDCQITQALCFSKHGCSKSWSLICAKIRY
jgi:hypothetical protein